MDSRLTPRGEEQARALRDALSHVPFDEVFSSDLGRAQRTAEVMAEGRGLTVRMSRLLRERNFGAMEGQHYRTLDETSPLPASLAHEERFRYKRAPDIESDEELVERFMAFVHEVAPRCRGQTILVVTHGGLMRTVLIALGYGTYANFSRRPIPNGAWVELVKDGSAVIVAATHDIPAPVG